LESHKKLLLANKAWVSDKLSVHPDYFSRMQATQTPEFLWIGCADSRVPAEDVTGREPGELFVHRNIANLVIHTDLNMLSVLQYAVEVLKVKHIIVCGHYGCGGVKHALSHDHLGLINKWLRHIKDVYRFNQQELNAIKDEDLKWRRLVELNVKEQVNNLAETSIVQKAWAKTGAPILHGWVYDLRSGLLNELSLVNQDSPMDPIFRFDFGDDDKR
jgi:carbonic anhydrase